ncbi:MAG: glutathione S-transferase [Methyloceanibacter sp.]|uniref:glutathione S-transferase n=1 Tax=Methyloceanibacter sp. TaxID=1965321 RepID=UPI003D6CEE09
MAESLTIEDCINTACPWSGKPVAPDSLMRYRGRVIGFCCPGCRDKFAKAAVLFDELIDPSELER